MAAQLTPCAVLLDLDGTLVDTMPALRAAYREFLERHGVEPTADEFEENNGLPLARVVTGLADRHGIDVPREQLYAEYLEILESSYVAGAEASPGARDLVAAARERGARIAVVTSAPHRLAEAVLKTSGLTTDVLVGGDDVSPGKPDPAPYREALRRTGAIPARAVALEDSESGIRSATGAGLRCIAIGAGAADSADAWSARESLAEAAPLVCAVLDGQAVAVPADRIAVEVSRPERRPPSDYDAAIEAAWADALASDVELFDGELLSVTRWRLAGAALEVEADVAGYRDLVAQRAGVALGVRPLGVSAVTVAGETVVIGRRSARVTQYRNHWELAASGTLPPAAAADPAGHLATELAEETGISPDQIQRMSPLGLIEDLAEDCFDLCYRVDIHEEVSLHSSTGEYSELRMAPVQEARQLAASPQAIPGMASMLDLLGAPR